MGVVLQERGIVQNAQCRVCKNDRETILHVPRDCVFVKHTWGKLGIVDYDQSCFNGNLGLIVFLGILFFPLLFGNFGCTGMT